jgi:hypothetical protein
MTRFAQAFGDKYQSAINQIRTRTFKLGEYEFKVRIPLSAEMDAMYKRITDIDETVAKERLAKMTEALRTDPPENVELKDDGDVVVDGRSSRELVSSLLFMENRITEHFKLLLPLEGDFSDITYTEINDEFPLPIQLEIVDAITAAIQPGYKDSRKNS